MQGRVFLVMFGDDAACRACDLRDAGWFVDAEHADGGQAYRVIMEDLPDVVVIDLTRRPLYGRELARALRETAATRGLPLVVVGGEALARAKVQAAVPDAVLATWDSLLAVLDEIVLHE